MITSFFRVLSIFLFASLIDAFQKVHFQDEVSNLTRLDIFNSRKVFCKYEKGSQKLLLNASCKIDRVELFNILGNSIASHQVSNDLSEINLSYLASGSYYGKVFYANNSQVFVVRK